MRKIRYTDNVSVQSQIILAIIASRFQFPNVESAEKMNITRQETDIHGDYTASYKGDNVSFSRVINQYRNDHKHLNSYLQFRPGSQSLTKFILDAHKNLQSLESDEEISAYQNEKAVFNSKLKLRIFAAPSEIPLKFLAPEGFKEAKWESGVLNSIASKQAHLGTAMSILGTETIDSILDSMRMSAHSLEEENLKYEKLKAYILINQEHEEKLQKLISPLVNESIANKIPQNIAMALGNLGTDVTQKYLRIAVERRRQVGLDYERLLPYLAQSETPSAETRQFMTHLAFDDQWKIKNATAVLNLGIVLGHSDRDSNSNFIREKMYDILKFAEHSFEKELIIYALSNASDDTLMDVVPEIVNKSPDKSLRKAAIHGLRRLNTKASSEFLWEIALQSSEAPLQSAAWSSLEHMEIEINLLPKISMVIRDEKRDIDVRLNALSCLWRAKIRNTPPDDERVESDIMTLKLKYLEGLKDIQNVEIQKAISLIQNK